MNTSLGIQNFWNEFIDLYRDLPALWKKGSEEYKIKKFKQRCYTILTNKLREILPDATIATTKKKINSLRSNYRKEVRKIEDSINMGADEDQLYTPRSWYFKKMSFLVNESSDSKQTNTVDTENDGDVILMSEDYECFEAVDDDDNSLNSKPNEEDLKHTNKTIVEHDDPLVRSPSPNASVSSNQKVHLKIERIEPQAVLKRIETKSADEKEQVSCSQSEPPSKRICLEQNDSGSEDECEILARAWIVEYKKLDAEQQLFANKAITDILFEGRMKKLSYHSVKVNQQCECKCKSKYEN